MTESQKVEMTGGDEGTVTSDGGYSSGYSSTGIKCNPKSFGARLRKAREKAGLTQRKLGELIGVSENTIYNYESGSLPKGQQLAALASHLSTSIDWLLLGPVRPDRREDDSVIKPSRSDEIVMVSKVKAKLNAGGGSLVTEGEEHGRYAFRYDWIHTRGNPARMVLMDVFGESMEPQIQDGDTVLIDQSQTEVITGRIYAVGVDEEVLVKYVEWRPGRMILRSANKDWQDIAVDIRGDQAETVRIIGRVIWWCREAR